MIHYHGLPITPERDCVQIIQGAHVLISHHYPDQLGIAGLCAKSFVLDNGAFSAWKKGKPVADWEPYLAWAIEGMKHPNCDWVIIPDVIGGSEKENDYLVDWFVGRWAECRKSPYSECVPVWHLHESFTRLQMLAGLFPRVAFGSSGDYSTTKTPEWWYRIIEAFRQISFPDGSLWCKVHGLRMLDPEIFTKLPLSSADSSAVARNVGMDSKWRGSYQPSSKSGRGIVLRQRIEFHNSARSIPDWEVCGQKAMFQE